MNPRTVHKRLMKLFERAMYLIVPNGYSVRVVEKMNGLSRSTLAGSLKRKQRGVSGSEKNEQPAFSKENEEGFVGTLERFTDHGIPLTHVQFKETTYFFVSTMSEERRQKVFVHKQHARRRFLQSVLFPVKR